PSAVSPPVLCPRPDRGVLGLSGADRVSFLQGLVSNDVTRAGPEQALWAAFLTPQGKYLHDFFVVSVGEGESARLLLVGEAARLEDLRARLSRYRLRSKVTLDLAGGWTVAVIPGRNAAASLGLPDRPGAMRALDGGGLAFVDPRLSAAGVHLLLPEAAAKPPLPLGEESLWQAHRLALGLPEGSDDLEPEKALLLENGFEELGGVDFKKGCYMGQELTARTKYRGLVKKRLIPVAIDGPLPAPGSALRTGEGLDAGEMRSGLVRADGQTLGLALLRLARLGGPILAEDGGATLTPSIPSWMIIPTAE
ncbi:CAF17-like 4Fe-4S cluster assembly/insertion protein YgfZ, partial [Rhodospirillum rubrum]